MDPRSKQALLLYLFSSALIINPIIAQKGLDIQWLLSKEVLGSPLNTVQRRGIQFPYVDNFWPDTRLSDNDDDYDQDVDDDFESYINDHDNDNDDEYDDGYAEDDDGYDDDEDDNDIFPLARYRGLSSYDRYQLRQAGLLGGLAGLLGAGGLSSLVGAAGGAGGLASLMGAAGGAGSMISKGIPFITTILGQGGPMAAALMGQIFQLIMQLRGPPRDRAEGPPQTQTPPGAQDGKNTPKQGKEGEIKARMLRLDENW